MAGDGLGPDTAITILLLMFKVLKRKAMSIFQQCLKFNFENEVKTKQT
jgi:hypothetical protein